MTFTFHKESILPASDVRSPYYNNLPPRDARPIDELVKYFKLWKHFIKALINYFRDLATSKELEANLSYQLINAIQFPGFKDLPKKYTSCIDNSRNVQAVTPTKELKKSLSSSSLASTMSNASTQGNGGSGQASLQTTLSASSQGAPSNSTSNSFPKRPGLLKTKSNNSSFMKNSNSSESHFSTHKRNTSASAILKSFNTLTQPVHHNTLLRSTTQLPNQVLHNNNDIQIPPDYFPDNSLFRNFVPILINHHFQNYHAQYKTQKELNQKLIPRSEILLKNLSMKIKEIKASLKNDSFVNDRVALEISETGKILTTYAQAVERYSAPDPVLKKTINYDNNVEEEEEGDGIDDPFLIKLRVDKQIKNQLLQENYMFASYVNLQNISKDLFTYINKELTYITERISKLVNNESVYASHSNESIMVNLLYNLKKHVEVSSSASWEHFISYNRNFLNLYKDTPVSKKKEPRYLLHIVVPYANSIHNKCLKSGFMYKKQKVLKSYHSNFYILTCNYLHEFDNRLSDAEKELRFKTDTPSVSSDINKSKNAKNLRKKDKDKIGGYVGYDDLPSKSYNLNNYALKNKDPSNYKFILQKISDPTRKITFKCADINDYESWYQELGDLCQFGRDHIRRLTLVEENVKAKEAQQKKQDDLKFKYDQAHLAATSAQRRTLKVSIPSATESRKSDAASAALSATKAHSQTAPTKPEEVSNTSHAENLEPKELFVLRDVVPQTPEVGTPSSIVSQEKNPFERTFSLGLQSTASSPNQSPAPIILTSPNANPIVVDSSPNELGHETYLKIQKQFLKQQQDLLDLKIQQSELLNNSHNSNQSVNATSPVHPTGFIPDPPQMLLNPNSRMSSSESISSMIQQANIEQTLNANNKILNHTSNYCLGSPHSDTKDADSIFKIPSNNSSSSKNSTSNSEIPTVFVSSDH